MKTLSNMLLMLSLSAPLFANNITPPPPPEKLAENTSTQDFPAIDQTFNSTVTNSNNTPLIADATTDTNPESKAEEPEMLPPLTVEGETWVFEESAYESFEGYIPKHSSTATKTDTPIIETPQSISVVSRRDMDIRNVRDVGEAVAYTAGASVGIGGDQVLFGGNAINIRGFGGYGTSGSSSNAYLDGMKLQRFGYLGSNLDPWLFERVEVLKGPASVLFGQTEPGGIVNRVSKRPYIGMLNQIRLGAGNFDKAHLAFDLGAELSDAWQFRAVGVALDGEARQVHSERERQLIAPLVALDQRRQ